MFCEKCGNELLDNANFCIKCGANIKNNTLNNNEKNNEPILEIKPYFKFNYIVLPKLLKVLIIFCIPIFLCLFMFQFFEVEQYVDICKSIAKILLGVGYMPIGIVILIKSMINKKQYANITYTFYKDRVVFKDNFLNISEKELKYKNIREITKRQTFMQRYFNIGNIALFSNAESGYNNSGISMINIKNVEDVYQKIKEITNI